MPQYLDRPIFVLGCARSGTTLLQLMLHAHPRIAIPPETRFIPEAYRRRLAFGDLSERRNRERLVDWVVDRKESKFGDLGVGAEAVRRRAHEVAPTLGSVLAVFLEQYSARWGKPRWGDKRPGYFRRMPELLRLFPDAQFLHIIRDGRDCVASLKRMPWWRHGVPQAVYYWVQAMQTSDWAQARLPDGQYAEVRYEDLVARPHDELERLCAFLGESFDEAMLEPHEAAADAVPKRKRARWHQRTTEQVSTGAIGNFRSGLDTDELRLMEAVAGRRLAERGYELSGRRLPPRPALLAEYGRHVLRVKAGSARLRRRERDRDRRYPWPVAAELPLAVPSPSVLPAPSPGVSAPEV